MSRHGEIELPWADRTGEGESYTFRLAIGELSRLEKRIDRGPQEMLARILAGTWRSEEIRETIRFGLIGGGSIILPSGGPDDRRINALLFEYVDNRPLANNIRIAALILDAALNGPADDPIPKPASAEDAPRSGRTASSPSPTITDGAPSSAGTRAKSTGSRSGSSRRRSRDTSARTEART